MARPNSATASASPARDAAFGKSLGGMIWPRGFVGAAAFWNYNASVDPSADGVVDAAPEPAVRLHGR